MPDEPKSVLENVARLERENAELAERIAKARAVQALEETIHTRPRPPTTRLRFAAALSFGLAFGLVMIAFTMLLVPPSSNGHPARHVRGGSAGVCR